MHQHSKTIIFVIALIVVVFLMLRFVAKPIVAQLSPNVEVSGKNENSSGKAYVGQEAPYFNLSSFLGGRVSRVDLAGSPTVLVFWSTWSSGSVDQIKILDDYLSEDFYNDKELNVQIVAINSQENPIVAYNFIRRGGYDVKVLSDQNGETSNNYGVQTLPTAFFIDRFGIVQEIFIGTLSKKMLVDKIENILQ